MQGEQASHDAIGRSQQVFFHNRAQEIQDRKSGHLTDMSDCHFFEFSQFRIADWGVLLFKYIVSLALGVLIFKHA